MIVVCALLAAVAVALAMPDDGSGRVRAVLPAVAPPDPPPKTRALPAGVAAVPVGIATALLVGGPVGAVLGVGVGVLVVRVIGRLEPAADRRRRESLERQAPLVADLLCATLAAGVAWTASLRAVCDALGDPASAALRPVVSALELGATPVQAWAGAPPQLRPIADAVARSADTGAPLGALLARLADDMRRDRRRILEVAARSAGVRSVAPLAACFLPSFLLLGVVPVVASLAGSLLAS